MCDKNPGLVFGGATKLSKTLNVLTWIDFFASELDESGPQSLPPELLPVLAFLQPKFAIWSFWPKCDQMSKIQIFFPGETFLIRSLTKVVRKVSLQEFLPILAVLPPIMEIRSFWMACDKNLWSVFGGATKWFKIQIFLSGATFLPRSLTKVVKKASLHEFYQFWPFYGQRLRFGLFNQNVTK